MKRKTNKIIALLLSVVMLLAVCPSVSYAIGFEYPENMTGKPDNSDEVISAYAQSHSHADAQPFTITSGTVEAGKYYLDSDITLTGNIYIDGVVDLCLNGHVLDLGGDNCINVSGKSDVLNIYDCNDAVVHRFSKTNGYWVLDEANGDIEVAGGVITGFNATATVENKEPRAIDVEYGATLNIYKANIVGNRIYEGGSIIFASKSGLNIYSAKLSYNYAGASNPVASRNLVTCVSKSNAFLGKNVEIKNNYFKVYNHTTGISRMLNIGYSTTDDLSTYVGGTMTSYAKLENNTASVLYENAANTLYINGLTCNNTSSGTISSYKGTTYINGNFEDNTANSGNSTNDYIISSASGASVYLNGKVTGNKAFFIVNIQKPASVFYLNGEITDNTSYNRTVNVTTGSTLSLLSGALIGDNILEDYSDPSYVAKDILIRKTLDTNNINVLEMPADDAKFETVFQYNDADVGEDRIIGRIGVAEGLDVEQVRSHFEYDIKKYEYEVGENEIIVKLHQHVVTDESTVPEVEPTCTKDGWSEITYCSVCGELVDPGHILLKLGHPQEYRIQNVGYRPATCMEDGYTGDIKCNLCQEIIGNGEPITAPGSHLLGEPVNYVAATDESTGYTGDRYCTREGCDYWEKGTIIPKGNHVDEKNNTTGESGHDHLCDNDYCGKRYYDCVDFLINKTGDAGSDHLCDYCGAWITDHTDNILDHYCDICGELMTELHKDENNDRICDDCGVAMFVNGVCYDSKVGDGYHSCDYCKKHTGEECKDVKIALTRDGIDYTDHSCDECGAKISVHNYKDTVYEPTCTEGGYTVKTCVICGEQHKADEVNALTHEFVIKHTATCTDSGLVITTCAREGCSLHEEMYEAALGHDLETEHKDATCTTDGYTKYTCNRDGCTYCETITEPALDHDIKIEHKAATCSEAGYTKYTCKRKGCDYCKIVTEPALDHTPVIDPAVAPTCTSTGLTEGSHCGVCGHVIVPQEKIPMLAHTDENHDHKCDVCGKKISDHKDEDGDRYCDICGIDMLSLITPDGRCKMCSKYEANKDKPVIGLFYTIIHYFVHLAHSIGNFT